MPRFLQPALCLLAAALACPVAADPRADVAEALRLLRGQRDYSWETIDLEPGPVLVPVELRTPGGIRSGRVRFERIQPEVRGSRRPDGTLLIRLELAAGARAAAVVRPDRSAVADTPDGWLSPDESEHGLAAKGPARGPARDRWKAAVLALQCRSPEQELDNLVDEVTGYRADGAGIIGVLTPEAASRAFGLSDAGYEVTDARGTVTFELSHGLLRGYSLRVAATVRLHGAGLADTGRGAVQFVSDPEVRAEHAAVTIIDYADPEVCPIPLEAARRLDLQHPPAGGERVAGGGRKLTGSTGAAAWAAR